MKFIIIRYYQKIILKIHWEFFSFTSTIKSLILFFISNCLDDEQNAICLKCIFYENIVVKHET